MSKDEKIKELEEKNKRLKELYEQKQEQESKEETKTNIYYGIRFVQMVCIGFVLFGALWKGTDILNLDTPEFMMVYGGAGALISEIVARVFKKKIIK